MFCICAPHGCFNAGSSCILLAGLCYIYIYIYIYMCVYLLAFGPSRHRAWVVGQRPLECSLGSRGRPLGGLLEAVLKPLGGRFGASWGLFGASSGHLRGLFFISLKATRVLLSFRPRRLANPVAGRRPARVQAGRQNSTDCRSRPAHQRHASTNPRRESARENSAWKRTG